MSITSIEWTQRTWNPVRGCSHVSPGCDNCYAERQGGRFCAPAKGKKKAGPFHLFVKKAKGRPRFTGKVELVEHMLNATWKVKEPTVWFVNSMSDLYHERLPFEQVDRVMTWMIAANWHTYQILTKRAKRMWQYHSSGRQDHGVGPDRSTVHLEEKIWLGVSVEDRKRKDRIKYLQDTPAAHRFISFEPLLQDLGTLDLKGIDVAIWGFESGPNARRGNLQWIRDGMQQARAAGCRNFVKQLGHTVEINDLGGIWTFKDSKGGDPEEWPSDVRVRELPS